MDSGGSGVADEVAGIRQVFDLTMPLGPDTPVFAGDPVVTLECIGSHDTHGYEVTRVSLGSHAGTHLDAPRHFIPSGKSLSEYDVSVFVGCTLVLDVRPTGHADSRPATSSMFVDSDLLRKKIGRWHPETGVRLLLYTGGAFFNEESATMLADLRPVIVGIDGPSLDPPESDNSLHKLLLRRGILIGENLCNLGQLGEGFLNAAFLPLALQDTDGAPARIVAWR